MSFVKDLYSAGASFDSASDMTAPSPPAACLVESPASVSEPTRGSPEKDGALAQPPMNTAAAPVATRRETDVECSCRTPSNVERERAWGAERPPRGRDGRRIGREQAAHARRPTPAPGRPAPSVVWHRSASTRRRRAELKSAQVTLVGRTDVQACSRGGTATSGNPLDAGRLLERAGDARPVVAGCPDHDHPHDAG